MDTKRTYYWLWAAIALLLCLNLLTIGWVVRRTTALRTNGAVPEGAMTRRLNFTPEQVKQYRQSRAELRRQSRPHEDSLRLLRTALLDQVRQPTGSDEQLDRLVRQMGQQHGALARLRFRHWKQVRSFCTPAQQARFDQLMSRVGQRINDAGQRARGRNRP